MRKRYAALLLTAALLLCLLTAGACSSGGEGAGEGGGTTGTALPALSPFTGLPLADAAVLGRRVLAVKVENDPAARPQSGLDQAELVIEEIIEGQETRFIAFFLASSPGEIGPIRSVRPTDMQILRYFDPLLVFSGGAPQVTQMVAESGLRYVTEETESQYFIRVLTRRAPHNLYTNNGLLVQALKDLGIEGYRWNESVFRFDAAGPAAEPGQAGGPASSITIAYMASMRVAYGYDAPSNTYLRDLAGAPHTDKVTGAQLAPSSVIVQLVQLEFTGLVDVLGTASPDSVVTGTGRALVFTGGMVTEGTWSKKDVSSRTVFTGTDGKEIPLSPGQVWLHLVPESVEVAYQ